MLKRADRLDHMVIEARGVAEPGRLAEYEQMYRDLDLRSPASGRPDGFEAVVRLPDEGRAFRARASGTASDLRVDAAS